jgi:phage shock protein PspC (stress-responsive transcriptional regulator)
MTAKDRWALAAAFGLPFTTITAYLLWVWPLPRGSSVIAQTGPYVLSLLTGLPFVWRLTRRSGRMPILLAFLAGGFLLVWAYALAILCAVRGLCL